MIQVGQAVTGRLPLPARGSSTTFRKSWQEMSPQGSRVRFTLHAASDKLNFLTFLYSSKNVPAVGRSDGANRVVLRQVHRRHPAGQPHSPAVEESSEEGIPRTPEADDRHIERMPSALSEVHRKVLSTS